jgi:3-phosphoshikimate 1-carboxyvinyltransferase
MSPYSVVPCRKINGIAALSGDKSIAHRALILSALAGNKTSIKNFPSNNDCLSTVNNLKKLSVKIKREADGRLVVFGNGLYGLQKPEGALQMGDSGTTLRLFLGLLAGQNFKVKLIAGKSLSQRPMLRVTVPLRKMGAVIDARRKAQKGIIEEYPPLTIQGKSLKPVVYKIPVASAQVKSAILLAGLYAGGRTTVIEPVKTRDHTERMLKVFGAALDVSVNSITLSGDRELVSPGLIYVPGDISSASFFMVLAAVLPDSHVVLKDVGLNPSRLGIVRVLKRMGSCIKIKYNTPKAFAGEPMGDISIKSSRLRATVIRQEEIPSLIDELPILMVAAALAQGKSIFRGVGELRVKETDRIHSMQENLSKMGAKISVSKNAGREEIAIYGSPSLKGSKVKSYGDHRTAMSMVVAGLKAQGKTSIDDVGCIAKSFPDFLLQLKKLIT